MSVTPATLEYPCVPPRPPRCLSLPAVITLRCMVQFIGRETKYRYGGAGGGPGLPWGRGAACLPAVSPLTMAFSSSSPAQRDAKRFRHDLPRRGCPGLLCVSADKPGSLRWVGAAGVSPQIHKPRLGIAPRFGHGAAALLSRLAGLTSAVAGAHGFPFCPPRGDSWHRSGKPPLCSHWPCVAWVASSAWGH